MKALLTGSRMYGRPGPDSDIDLVVQVPREVADALADFAPEACSTQWRKGAKTEDGEYPIDSVAFRFGVLNLITVFDDVTFDAWKIATDTCVAMGPINREAAIAIHKSVREAKGVQ